MTECEEVADNMPIEGVRTWKDAERVVRAAGMSPQESGYQVFDNVVEALLERARRG